MKTVTINQTIYVSASPSEVYHLLMNAEAHAELTSGEAIIEDREGAAFSIFNGYAKGTNLKLEKDKLIIQNWRAEEEGWPHTHFSRITYELVQEKKGTRIEFMQENLPEHLAADISQGWFDFYWNPMKELLGDPE